MRCVWRPHPEPSAYPDSTAHFCDHRPGRGVLLADWIRVYVFACPEEHEVSSAGVLYKHRRSGISVRDGFVASG
jgi:hypothetical protein